jgi:catechol 2,3-dioxygenase-like lactoylglutathione lyase family enzyme
MFGNKIVKEGLASRKLVAFVATRDAARAKEFYGRVLGLRLTGEDGFALVFDANGTTLRVSVVRELSPAPYTVLGWLVPDVEQSVRELMARSVVFARFDGLEQDDLCIWTAPGGAKVAWFRDPDGNTLSITQTR